MIVNRLKGDMPPALDKAIQQLPIPLLGTVPSDTDLMDFEFSGRQLVELGDDSQVFRSVAEKIQQILKD